MEYFSQFPKINYTFDAANNDFQACVNIFARSNFLASILDNALIYYPYSVKDSDSIPTIAYKYYGDSKRHWVVYFANQIIDPYNDLPLTVDDLNNQLIAQYGSLANAQGTLYQVEEIVTTTTSLNGGSNTSVVTAVLEAAYTYNFATGHVQSQTFPTLMNPTINLGNTTVTLHDGSVVTQNKQLQAVSAYDFYYAQNEQKRTINLLDKQYITQVESQFKQLMAK